MRGTVVACDVPPPPFHASPTEVALADLGWRGILLPLRRWLGSRFGGYFHAKAPAALYGFNANDSFSSLVAGHGRTHLELSRRNLLRDQVVANAVRASRRESYAAPCGRRDDDIDTHTNVLPIPHRLSD